MPAINKLLVTLPVSPDRLARFQAVAPTAQLIAKRSDDLTADEFDFEDRLILEPYKETKL